MRTFLIRTFLIRTFLIGTFLVAPQNLRFLHIFASRRLLNFVPIFHQGGESDADKFQVTITLFREEEYGKMEQKKVFSAQRSYTGKVRQAVGCYADNPA